MAVAFNNTGRQLSLARPTGFSGRKGLGCLRRLKTAVSTLFEAAEGVALPSNRHRQRLNAILEPVSALLKTTDPAGDFKKRPSLDEWINPASFRCG